MTTLDEVLSQKDKIIENAKKLGFVDVNVYRKADAAQCLCLVVSLDPTNQRANELNLDLLSADLTVMLRCHVAVFLGSALRYAVEVERQCAPITDRSKISEKFQTTALDQVLFENPKIDINARSFKKQLQLSQEIKNNMAQALNPGSSSFNLLKRRFPDEATSSSQPYQGLINTLLEPTNSQLAAETLNAMPPSMLQELQTKYDEVKRRHQAQSPVAPKPIQSQS
jgi:hypothetical protein